MSLFAPKIIRMFLVFVSIALASSAASSATITASVSAQASKPLTLTKVQDLNLGSITLAPGSWINAVVSISQSGQLTCNTANLICAGQTNAATYTVEGSNQQTVYVSSPNITLTNQSAPAQSLTLRPDAPSSIVLKNSGNKGTDFSVGGAVTLNSSVQPGTYVGAFNVTVNY